MTTSRLAAAVVAAVVGWVSLATAAPGGGEGPPPAGLTGGCVITEVYDGDTVVVRFTVTARVRLLDCWCDEIRTRDPAEKARGLAARDHLADLLGFAWDEGAKRWRGEAAATLHAPFPGTGDVGSLFTLSRLVGSLWLPGERKSLSERQVEAGHAFRTKAELAEAVGR